MPAVQLQYGLFDNMLRLLIELRDRICLRCAATALMISQYRSDMFRLSTPTLMGPSSKFTFITAAQYHISHAYGTLCVCTEMTLNCSTATCATVHGMGS